ncbi:MAG: hypothetical protein QM783_03910 [Phycisphaerales bacterium]
MTRLTAPNPRPGTLKDHPHGHGVQQADQQDQAQAEDRLPARMKTKAGRKMINRKRAMGRSLNKADETY